MNAVILVEGMSDQRAVEALAVRRGRDLEAEGVSVVPIGGAHAIGHALERYGPRGLDARLAGLYDVGEERLFARGLERAGLGKDLDRAGLENLGFYACDTDLEHELVRALGIAAVARIIDREGELGRFETFRKQLAKRDLPFERAALGLHVEPEDPLRAAPRGGARPRQRAPPARRRARRRLSRL